MKSQPSISNILTEILHAPFTNLDWWLNSGEQHWVSRHWHIIKDNDLITELTEELIDNVNFTQE